MNRVHKLENSKEKNTMKKLLAILLTVTIVLSTVLVALPTVAAGETENTRALPVALATDHEAKLQAEGYTGISSLSGMAQNGKYYLTQDITVTSQCSLPNGVTLDGNGHTITYTGKNALFGYSADSTVKNLILTGSIKYVGNGQGGAGNDGVISNGIENDVTFSNIYSDVSYTVTTGSLNHLGFSAKNQSNKNATFTNVINAGNIIIDEGAQALNVGGLLGYASTTAQITGCEFRGKIIVNGKANYVGGMIGKLDGGSATFSNCANKGDISLASQGDAEPGVGGFVGWADVSITATNCQNTGLLSSTARGSMGGFIGFTQANATLTNCDNLAVAPENGIEIHANFASAGNHIGTGGIVGRANDATLSLENCDNKADVKYTASGTNDGCNQLGGMLGRGQNLAGFTATNCTNSGAITIEHSKGGWDGAAGIVGSFMTRNSGAATYSITNCVNTGAITAPGCAAGIFGTTGQLSHKDIIINISNSMNFGKITVTAADGSAGGIAGVVGEYTWSPTDNPTQYAHTFYQFKVYNCVNVGEVTASNGGWSMGGIVASWGSDASRVYATDNNPTIPHPIVENCVNAGYVHTPKNTGRIGDPWANACGIVGNLMSPI